MKISRKIVVSASAFALSAAFVTTLVAGPASAAKSPPFKGDAVGKVSCTGVLVKLKFSPPATLSGGGTNVSFKGKLSGCTVSGTPAGVTEVIQQGKITGSTVTNGTGCAGFASGSNNVINATVVWKGKYNNGKASFTNTTATLMGDVAANDPSGNTGFEVPNPSDSGSTTTGSFAGSVTDESFFFSSMSSNAILNQCNGPHGLKKLNLTHGSVTAP